MKYLKKSYELLKYWYDTNTENGVTTIPEFVVKGALREIEQNNIQFNELKLLHEANKNKLSCKE